MKAGYHLDGTTILAAASPPGHAQRGILRLSGPRSWPCVSGLVGLNTPPSPRRLHPCRLRLPRLAATVPALLAWMPAPRSYTREDVLEIHTFGCPALLSCLTDALLARGALLAGPGEFTRRAFLNGRIDLTRAEAVLDLIRARDAAEHRQACEQLRGTLHRSIAACQQRILHVCAFGEAAIDFSDQDIEVIDPAWVEGEIGKALAELDALLEESQGDRARPEGVRVLLFGRPNVGKSSLLNALARRPAALVSPFPGTTRDGFEIILQLRGFPFRLRDAAGVREALSPPEQAGIQRALEAVESADLILLVLDGSQPVSCDDRSMAARVDPARTLLVVNKSDLPAGIRLGDLPADLERRPSVRVSALTSDGVETLVDVMVRTVETSSASAPGQSFWIHARQRGCLMAASRCLRSALASAQSQTGFEFVALDLREALQHLGEVVGEVVNDDLLDLIFSRFCIGK